MPFVIFSHCRRWGNILLLLFFATLKNKLLFSRMAVMEPITNKFPITTIRKPMRLECATGTCLSANSFLETL